MGSEMCIRDRPNGEPRFLEKGVTEMIQQDADAIIKRVMGL